MNLKSSDLLHINSFVRRQTPESHLSHWILSDDELIARVRQAAENGKVSQGYRDGVVLAHIAVQYGEFYTGQVILQEGDQLVGEYKPRRQGEEPRKVVMVHRPDAEKVLAKAVDVVLYHASVLAEDDDNETEEGWEIISVNARPTYEDEPINPETLMANQFGADGGTDTLMTESEFYQQLQESFHYWKNRGNLAPSALPRGLRQR